MKHAQQEDPQDKMREMFRAARDEDGARAPAYRRLVEAPREKPRRSGRPLVLAAIVAAGLTLAVASLWLPLWQEEPAPVPVAQSTPPEVRPAEKPIAIPKEKPADVPATSPEIEALKSLGYVGPQSDAAPRVPPPPLPPMPAPEAEATRTSDAFILDLTVPGRAYQNVLTLASGVQNADGDGSPNVNGSRSRDVQFVQREAATGVAGGVVGGVSAGVVGGFPSEKLARSRVNPNPLERERSDLDSGFNTESYAPIAENDFQSAMDHPLSTFSIDVDTASWSNVRRFLRGGQRPPVDAVRIEEMINYFSYDYPQPDGTAPFSATVEIADCPWAPEHRLARIGLKGRDATRGTEGGSNLVFLIDVSGSMDQPNKLPLVQQALTLLADQLDGRDQVAIVVYAGASGLVLPSTSGANRGEIREAIQRLSAGGATNGAAGLLLAYQVARENFIEGGINRVILATDGDFNVGVTSRSELLEIIEADAKKRVFLTALGFGMGNYKDDTLETLADKGNGNYAYIDDLREARKVLVEQIGGTLITIAKDVKIQVEFNPAQVGAYRLIGYENRMLKKEDFNDDRKDAGEIGAGHSVTALYEILPPGAEAELPQVDPLRYQTPASPSGGAASKELFTLKLRYKEPDGDESKLLSFPIADEGLGLDAASADFKFAAAVAELGMLLRGSAHAGSASLEQVRELALAGQGSDEGGYRAEFLELVAHGVPGK